MSFHTALLESRLQKLLQKGFFSSKEIKEASLYAISSGKKFRPLLILALAEHFSVPLKACLDPACSIEMVHSFSLIHDDLPCMDNDDFRRGKPSVHKAFGEPVALLAGDFLLAYAFEVLSKSPNLTDTQKISLIQILGRATGNQGMIAGQNLDLSSVGKTLSEKTLIKMHYYKTACLIAAACSFVAVLAGLSSKESALLKKLGTHLGIAYQIQDDLLDVFSEEPLLGKPLFSDKEKNKPTAISTLGVFFSKETIKNLHKSILRICDKLSLDSPFFQELLQKIFERKQ